MDMPNLYCPQNIAQLGQHGEKYSDVAFWLKQLAKGGGMVGATNRIIRSTIARV